MTPVFLAFVSTLAAVGILAFLTPVPAFVPFPKLDSTPLPADISASVAEARRRQRTAEEAQETAEREAATHFGSLARLTIEAKELRTRLKEARAWSKALEDLKYPAAVELVSKMSNEHQADDSVGGESGSESASTDHKPKPPGRRS